MAPSSVVPGWWQRTWPLVALGVLSIAMWSGRIRNVLGDDDLVGFGRVFRLAMAASFVGLGVALLVACWIGSHNRNWRESAHRAADGWRAGAGVPAWGRSVASLLVAYTVVVWLVQGIGIAVDPNHGVGFKVVHSVLAAGSLVVAGFGVWGLRRGWPVAPPSRTSVPSS